MLFAMYAVLVYQGINVNCWAVWINGWQTVCYPFIEVLR